MRGSADPIGVGEGDLVLSDDGFGFTFERAQEADLPNVSRVAYFDSADYRQAQAEARRLVAASDRVATSSLPLVLSPAEASGIGERLLQDAWVMRERGFFCLPPSLLALDPADEVQLRAGGRTRRLRISAIDDGSARQIESVATDPSLYEPFVGAERSIRQTAALRQTGRALLVFLDLPLVSDAQDPDAPMVAAYADPWPGTVQVFKGSILVASLAAAASLGETVEDFWSGPLDRWDRVNPLRVSLINGSLSSADDAAVFAGANALALENPDGGWEIVQFADAELVGPGRWHLTRLLRGRCGSEQAMANPLPAGARVVVLNQALGQLALSAAESRLPHTYIYGPAGKPLADPAFQSLDRTFSAAGLVPPAPCHVRFAWHENGDLTISWLRRDRSPAAASLLQAETPRSDPDSYDLEILSNSAVVRSFTAIAQHSQVYTAVEQAADFPSGLPDLLTVRVFQRSSVIGRGRPKTESLHVR
jgi:Putative phage tail protein